MSIIVQEVTRRYGEQKALDNVSFTVSTGEIVGFLGPNGSGKSTMMKIITGYIPPTTGKVLVNHIDVAENTIAVREKIGYLPEHNPLYHDMYVREYLRFISRVYRLGRNAKERIGEIIELTGLTAEQHKKIGALSKGYRQRVGLAQALIHDPEILILDEPTSGLDPNQIVEIRKLISEAGKHKTVLLSTHIMQEVEAVCDRIIIIDNGQLRADDTKEEIYSRLEKQVNALLVEFDVAVEEKLLLTIPYVTVVRRVSDQRYLLESPALNDIRPLLFRFAVDNGYTVLSMQLREHSLEELFRQLTR